MNKPKMVILADLGSLRVTCVGFKQIVSKLENNFEIVACKFYSYVAKRNRDFNEFISANGYDTSLPSVSRKRNKLDGKQVIDAADLARIDKIDAIALATGEGDILPVVNVLKSSGKEVYDIAVYESKYSYAYNGFIAVPVSALREGYAAPATKPVIKKPPKPVIAPVRPVAENPHIAEAKSILAKYKK